MSLQQFTTIYVDNFVDENMIGETVGSDARHEDPATDLQEGINHHCYL